MSACRGIEILDPHLRTIGRPQHLRPWREGDDNSLSIKITDHRAARGRSALGAQRLLQTHCIVENTNPHLQPLLFERARYLFQ